MSGADIRAEVEGRKQRAKDLRLDQIVFRLWNDYLRSLDEDFDHEQNCMPQSLTKVLRTEQTENWRSWKTIELFLPNTSITLTFEEYNTPMPDGDIWTSGHILVNYGAKTVFDLRCTCSDDIYIGREWDLSEVEGFIEGPWVEELTRFAQQVFSLHGQMKSRLKEERKEDQLQQLKSKFGI